MVNVAPSISGRYPNLGPDILLAAGVPLLDDVGAEAFGQLREGDRVRVCEDTVYAMDGRVLGKGDRQTAESVAQSRWPRPGKGCPPSSRRSPSNTMEYLRRERDLLLDGVGVPDITTELDGRHVLVVVRGYTYREDLVALRHYVREYKPVLIGVDGGADALLERGPEAAPDRRRHGLRQRRRRCAAAPRSSSTPTATAARPGLARVQELGIDAGRVPGGRHQRGRRAAARRRQGRRR